MPLTPIQEKICRLLAANRTEDSYLAGGAALHLEPTTRRVSEDLDYFNDSDKRVAHAFESDRELLESAAFDVRVDISQQGFIRASVSAGNEGTRIDWARESGWRFLPLVRDERTGFRLHPVDLAINKTLALAGRDEARDLLDVVDLDQELLPLGALCWAAVGKDPGFSPLSLLELLRRRGTHRAEEFDRLRLARPVDLQELKSRWLTALADADGLVRSLPAEEEGCLYWSTSRQSFFAPGADAPTDLCPHFGRAGGVLPVPVE